MKEADARAVVDRGEPARPPWVAAGDGHQRPFLARRVSEGGSHPAGAGDQHGPAAEGSALLQPADGAGGQAGAAGGSAGPGAAAGGDGNLEEAMETVVEPGRRG